MTIPAARRFTPVALIAAVWLSACASAPPPPPGGPGGGAPPQELVDACKTLKEGDACTAKGPQGEMKGTCAKAQDDKIMCKPEGAPPGGPPAGGPPPGGPGGAPPSGAPPATK
jgi:spore coat protein H